MAKHVNKSWHIHSITKKKLLSTILYDWVKQHHHVRWLDSGIQINTILSIVNNFIIMIPTPTWTTEPTPAATCTHGKRHISVVSCMTGCPDVKRCWSSLVRPGCGCIAAALTWSWRWRRRNVRSDVRVVWTRFIRRRLDPAHQPAQGVLGLQAGFTSKPGATSRFCHGHCRPFCSSCFDQRTVQLIRPWRVALHLNCAREL